MSDYRKLNGGLRRVVKARRCSNGHQMLVGDMVSFYTGIVEGQFEHYEECRRCVHPQLHSTQDLHRKLEVHT